MSDRTSPISAVERRRAVAVIGAFTDQLAGWHSRLATLTGQRLSRRFDPKPTDHDLDRLQREVDDAYAAFKISVSNEPATDESTTLIGLSGIC